MSWSVRWNMDWNAMKRVGVGIGLVLLLGGCGNLLGGVLPDTEVDDPLQIDGATVSVSFGDPPPIRLQAVAGRGELDAPIAFDDQDIGGPVAPVTLTIDAGFEAEAVLEGDIQPDRIVLSDIEVEVRMWQGTETFAAASSDDRIEFDPFVASGDLTLDKVDPDCTASCVYAFAFPAVADSSLQIEIDGSDLTKVLAIVGEAPDANFVDVVVSLVASSSPELGPGSSLTLTFDAADGTFDF